MPQCKTQQTHATHNPNRCNPWHPSSWYMSQVGILAVLHSKIPWIASLLFSKICPVMNFAQVLYASLMKLYTFKEWHNISNKCSSRSWFGYKPGGALYNWKENVKLFKVTFAKFLDYHEQQVWIKANSKFENKVLEVLGHFSNGFYPGRAIKVIKDNI